MSQPPRSQPQACGKNRYPTEAEARKAIWLHPELTEKDLKVYRCERCGGWHLTSQTGTYVDPAFRAVARKPGRGKGKRRR